MTTGPEPHGREVLEPFPTENLTNSDHLSEASRSVTLEVLASGSEQKINSQVTASDPPCRAGGSIFRARPSICIASIVTQSISSSRKCSNTGQPRRSPVIVAPSANGRQTKVREAAAASELLSWRSVCYVLKHKRPISCGGQRVGYFVSWTGKIPLTGAEIHR